MKNKKYNNVIIHYKNDKPESNKCEHRGALLFIDDVSDKYKNNQINKVCYNFLCLDCGEISDFSIVPSQLRIIYISTANPILKFYNIRSKYLKLKQNDIDIEEIVRIINEEYENQDTLKIKKLNRLQK